MDFNQYARNLWENTSEQRESRVREERILKKINRKIFWRSVVLKTCVGAVSAAACVAALVLIFTYDRGDAEFAPSDLVTCVAGESRFLELPDGTGVWMDEGASLSYPESMSESRVVRLDGNAVFDVVKMPDSKEFTILLKGSRIVVHGTTFSINETAGENINVVLYSGAIDFISEGNGQMVSMKPGNSLSFNYQKSTLNIAPLFDGISWQDGKFIINNASLSSLIGFLSWKYDRAINLSGGIDGNQSFNGVVHFDEELTEILESICFMLDLDYKITENGYDIVKP